MKRIVQILNMVCVAALMFSNVSAAATTTTPTTYPAYASVM